MNDRLPNKDADMDIDAIMAALSDNNPAERAQAKALHEQARANGLRFETYLPPALADWLLAHIERGRFTDPSEAAFLIFGSFRDLERNRDLFDALLLRTRDATEAELAEGQADHDIFVGLDARYAESCPEAALWEPIAR